MNPIRTLSTIAVLAAATVAGTSQAAAAGARTITVSGTGIVTTVPNQAQFSFGASTTAPTARAALTGNAARMTRLVAALKGAGIDEKDVQTSRISLQPQYSASVSNRPGPTSIVGYRASNRVMVRIRDVGKVAGVIDTLVGAGANDIGNISFSVSHASQLLDDARERAVADARRKAEIYAKAAGVTLGAPLNISEVGAAAPLFRAKVATAMGEAATPIAQGEETLSISVNVTFAIKPGP